MPGRRAHELTGLREPARGIAVIHYQCCILRLDCMGRDEPTRKFGEATLFGESSNIVPASEGQEKIIRIRRWTFGGLIFRRMEMVASLMYKANLVLRWTGRA
ncbi:unnamed protein product [Linum trigynum]|uniref:Cyclic nucleotide-binding domain-containing protein n=1 Tax=Linum trigynum TaxID=586398 RepID=A0AAV2FI78_9ROSI